MNNYNRYRANTQTIPPPRRSITRPTPGPATRHLIPKSKLPSQHQLLDHLSNLHASTSGRTPLPEEEPTLPPTLPKSLWDSDYANPASVGLLSEDLDPNKPTRNAPLQRILTALQIKHYRALGLPPPTQYRVHTTLTHYNESAPALPRGNVISIAPAMEPIKVLKGDIDNWKLITDKAANTGVPIVPNLSHSNDCRCMALYANNNYETLQPLRACLPVDFYKKYTENECFPSAAEMGFAAPVYKSASDIYMSEVSSAGTVLMHMIRRSPVAAMTR